MGNVGGVSGSGISGAIGNQVDLQTLMFTVMAARSEVLDGQVRGQANKVKNNNSELGNLNAAMSAANQRTQSGGKPSDCKFTATDPTTGEPKEYTLKSFCDSRGIAYPSDPDDNYSKEEWGIVVSNIKNSVDSLTSSSQLEMTGLQSTMNKYNQTFEALSNFISKYSESLNTVTGNLR